MTRMKEKKEARRASIAAVIEAALVEFQPALRIVERAPNVVVEGKFELSGPEGPFDEYDIRIVVPYAYPRAEPHVFETGHRIPHDIDRHVNVDGTCCVTVWEAWRATVEDTSFKAFIEGPVHEFFLSQWWFERDGIWRFGERPHGASGLLAAYAEALGVEADGEIILRYLRALAKEKPRGHWECPCGSGHKVRDCPCRGLHELHKRISPTLAKDMLGRLKIVLAV